MAAERAAARPAGTQARLAWAFYDWAASPFAAIVITFVFPTYFARAIVGDEVQGTALWGWAMTASALLIAVLSPPLGAIADAGGRRKPWLLGATVTAGLATAGLWWAEPGVASIPLMLLVVLANTALETGQTFYNAMLPDLVPAGRLGRWSGWGWGLGYASGIVALGLVLTLLIQRDPPPFGLDPATAEQVRIIGPLVGLWLLLFALPLFAFCPDRPPAGRRRLGRTVGDGLRRLAGTWRGLRAEPDVLRFLIARLVYNDGLNTLFAFGGIYAAGTFGMGLDEIIQLGIALNLTAGLGAAAMAPLDDRLGSKATILIALGGLMLAGTAALLATGKAAFWAAALALGLFVGPAQSASRTFMARLAPPDRLGELFGLYALSGKITAFLGPFLFGSATLLFASQRAGMATVLAMFTGGALLLLRVREPARP